MNTSRIILSGIILISILFTSCKGLSKLSTSDNDDVYLDPKKDRSYFYKIEEPKVAVVSAPAKLAEDTTYNPAYKAKEFKYDDYYDNQYASRLKHFHNPMNGVGYYDSYYTNSYFYNNNPYQYGVSIYNGYNFYGSSYNNYMYVPNYNWNGFGSNVGYNSYCNNGWGNNSFGYNNGWGNNNYYNSPFYGGWGNQYGNNYNNNNYGYNNSYDYNSNVYNGPRISHSGGNSRQVINPGMANGRLMSQPILDNSSPKTAMPPTDIKRFDQVVMPKQNMVKGNDNINDNVPHVIHSNNGSTSTPVKGVTNSVNNEPRTKQPVVNNDGPVKNEPSTEPRPKKGNFFNNETTPSTPKSSNGNTTQPKPNVFQIEHNGGGKTNSTPSGNGGGTVRPSSGGNNGGGVKPRR